MDPITLGLIGTGAGAAASFGSSLLGSLLSYGSASEANEINYAIARENRQWMEKMANTAHQREVQDLRAAGLNPILSATGGAGAATPSADTSYNPHLPDWSGIGRAGNAIAQGVSTALDWEKKSSDIEVNAALARQANSAADFNSAKTATAYLDNRLKSLTEQYRVDKERLGVQEARHRLASGLSDLAVKQKQNAWLMTPEGHSAWTEAQKAKQYTGVGGSVLNSARQLFFFGRSLGDYLDLDAPVSRPGSSRFFNEGSLLNFLESVH